ncbi:MBL fold metallo-hydrolase [Saccharothrix deserti]|uniref:MBL fold metallo-hydrolase n=1 Tax=Saccharothrix deserti TaxID=2593674 RepID=UPI00131CA7F7|nr:MBL fold metallo-hydrolase [Saccharothrix deserti]
MTFVTLGSRTKVLLQPGGWFLNNAGWVVGDERALLVDTLATEDRSRRLLDAVRADSGTLPLTAVLTHAHGDHANGARLVVEQGGTVHATPPTVATVHDGPHTFPMAFECSTWGDITPPRITDTITGPVELDLGGVRVDLLPVDGTAHTDGDLVALVREDGVLFAGDLVFAGTTPLAVSGSITGWLAALDWLADIEHTHLVPGHGLVLPAHSQEVDDMRAYLEWLLDTASHPDYDHAAATRDASVRWAHWPEGERHTANLLVAEADLKGVAVSLPAAVGAMLAVTGGRIKLDL